MYIKYSTRNFKASHLERIKSLKAKYPSFLGTTKTQEEIVVMALEVGLAFMEQHMDLTTVTDLRIESDDKVLYEIYKSSKKRTAPLGIKDD